MDFLRRTWVEIDMRALVNNFKVISQLGKQKVYAVVKADAYGHGAVPVAYALDKAGAYGFAVSNLVEAEELRNAGIAKPILILGYTPVECTARLAKNQIEQCVFSEEYACELNDEAKRLNVTINVHIKIDTGMGRIGFSCREGDVFDLNEVKRVYDLVNLNAVGIFMHFAVADSIEDSHVQFTKEQYDRFWNTINELEQDGYHFELKHCCNSAAALCLDQNKGDAVRAGIIMYGLAPSDELEVYDRFTPVMAMYSVVSLVKTIQPAQTVSYGRTYIAQQSRKIATVCAGYADGVPRLISNKGYVLIKGKRAPIVGRVCMDQFCIDVTDIDDVSRGDVVTIFGPGLSVDEAAAAAETINYEVVCGITKRVPRCYINE